MVLSSSFESTMRLHGITTLLVGLMVYTQCLPDVVTMFGVGAESAHSLRNSGFLLILVSFLSFSTISPLVRNIPAYIGRALSGSDLESSEAFVSGIATASNMLLLVHYTVEAFYHSAVSKVFVVLVWVLTICAILKIKISLEARKTGSTKPETKTD